MRVIGNKNKWVITKMKIKEIYNKEVDWNYIKSIKYGKIEQYDRHKTEIGNLAGYVREKRCLDCKTKTIKYNRCKRCYYKRKGWDLSRLLDKQKEGNKRISTATDERLEILRDSGGSFRSDSEGEFAFPASITERLKHSERD